MCLSVRFANKTVLSVYHALCSRQPPSLLWPFSLPGFRAWTSVCVGVCMPHPHATHASEDNFVESHLPFYLFIGSRGWTQVTRFAWQTLSRGWPQKLYVAKDYLELLITFTSQTLGVQTHVTPQFMQFLGLEHGVSCVLDNHSTNWATAPGHR